VDYLAQGYASRCQSQTMHPSSIPVARRTGTAQRMHLYSIAISHQALPQLHSVAVSNACSEEKTHHNHDDVSSIWTQCRACSHFASASGCPPTSVLTVSWAPCNSCQPNPSRRASSGARVQLVGYIEEEKTVQMISESRQGESRTQECESR
jgi:hypothetical protein